MVIVEQANRLLSTISCCYYAELESRTLAYWGHGQTHESQPEQGWRDSINGCCLTFVDWWFAYTLKSAESVIAGGVRESHNGCSVSLLATRTAPGHYNQRQHKLKKSDLNLV